MRAARPRALLALAVAFQLLFFASLFAGLGAPLLWEDEARDGDARPQRARIRSAPGPPRPATSSTARTCRSRSAATKRSTPISDRRGASTSSPRPRSAWSDRASDLAARTWRVRVPFALAGWLGVLMLGAPRREPVAAARAARAVVLARLRRVPPGLGLAPAPPARGALLPAGRARARRHRADRGAAPRARRSAAAAPRAAARAGVCSRCSTSSIPHSRRWSRPPAARSRSAPGPRAPLRARAIGVRARRGALRARVRRGAAARRVLRSASAEPRVLREFGGPRRRFATSSARGPYYLVRFELLVPAACGARRARRRAPAARRRTQTAAPRVRGVRPRARARRGLAGADRAHAALLLALPRGALAAALRACVLQIGCLVALRRTAAARAATAGLAAMTIAGLGCAAVRVPELRGRVAELREPYRGPLDHVIPYLAAALPEPRRPRDRDQLRGVLVTCSTCARRHVLGYYAPERERDLAFVPDVIIPRPWPRTSARSLYLAQQRSVCPAHLSGGEHAREQPAGAVAAQSVGARPPVPLAGARRRRRRPADRRATPP